MYKRCLLAAVCTLFVPALLHAQALPAATRAGIIQVGGGVSIANPDYTQKYIKGVTIYSTFDFSTHLGIEANYHNISVITPDDLGENSFQGGLRYVYRKGRYEPYAKGLIGLATFNYQGNQGSTPFNKSYWDYALGGGLDIRLGHHINIRAIDAELQTWPTFSPNNLTPMVFTVGVAYRLR